MFTFLARVTAVLGGSVSYMSNAELVSVPSEAALPTSSGGPCILPVTPEGVSGEGGGKVSR